MMNTSKLYAVRFLDGSTMFVSAKSAERAIACAQKLFPTVKAYKAEAQG